ncbi:26S proteasome non-ATPase regulatory subunit 10-like [Haliotis rubra]|uniref:26S proteasome non-ATPase regulatory subunit 10-like n=1 Tax=Haliotis rubra TaxID=36100 RepID=UPI001EE50E0D|nr:26S proteasome non-ATPase regulatory subunit 10-like [Haliotis rubra]
MARPIIEAIRSGDVALAKKLLHSQKQGCLDCQTSRRDGTALFWAACRGVIELVELLLTRNASVNASTGYGATPLHAAADAGRVQVIRLLVKYGADVNSLTQSGDTPCHLAAYRGNSHAVQVLVEEGANLNSRNRKCHRPVDEAEANGHFEIVEYLTAVSGTFRCGGQEPDMSIPGSPVHTLSHQRVPFRVCNSSPVFQTDTVLSPAKGHHHVQFYHAPDVSSHINIPTTTDSRYLGQCHTVNDLSIDTDSVANSSQISYFNIPLYD